MPIFISVSYLREELIEKRDYQLHIAASALRGNTLVVLPTGLGKTIIAIMVIAEVLERKGGKILFLAPTKPLVVQHAKSIKKLMNIEEEKVVVFTGDVKKATRPAMWKEAQIIVSTPQVIQNDIISGDISLDEVSLVIFDEAHRAVGNYAYVFIAQEYAKKEDHLILAITASPGGSEEKIMEIIENLGIENVEIRTDDDPDVKPYIKGFKMRYVELPMPAALKDLYAKLKELRDDIIAELRKFGLFVTVRSVSRKDIIMEQRSVQAQIQEGKSEYYQAAMLLNMAIKIDYALEYLETQGFESCFNYLMKLIEEGNSKGGSKASRTLVRHRKFIEIVKLARELQRKIDEIDNPKIEALKKIIKKKLDTAPESRIIVFTHYRDTAQIVADALEKEGFKAVRFVGQANKGEDKGMNQKKQVEIINRFRNGEYNVLVATSVAEEGLDIPATDMVIFYEPVPSEIRYIQRRGRTGRTSIGEVVILTIKGTRDIAYLWSSKKKERKMKNELLWLRMFLKDKVKESKRRIFPEEEKDKVATESNEKKDEGEAPKHAVASHSRNGQLTLLEFENVKAEKPIIYVDTREFRSEVVKQLADEFRIVPVQMSVGDYIISEEVAIERKTTNDFLESLRDGRLFTQLKKLKNEYQKPVIIIEGDTLFSRGFHENAIYGALASVVMDFSVPVIFTKNAKETAKLIAAMRQRTGKGYREIPVRKNITTMSDEERQRFIVESLPNVSATLSKRLLEHFGSVRNVIDAEVGELINVRGIGRKTAEEIHEIINKKYQKKKD
ncbi:MAG: DEAD/DEAH box helicase [Euryarchaeota archaeon]|nr:DEAD/DEAH box helicase [Euryarchaeota archaeon]